MRCFFHIESNCLHSGRWTKINRWSLVPVKGLGFFLPFQQLVYDQFLHHVHRHAWNPGSSEFNISLNRISHRNKGIVWNSKIFPLASNNQPGFMCSTWNYNSSVFSTWVFDQAWSRSSATWHPKLGQQKLVTLRGTNCWGTMSGCLMAKKYVGVP